MHYSLNYNYLGLRIRASKYVKTCHKGTKKIFLKYEKLDCKFVRETKDIKGDRFSLGSFLLIVTIRHSWPFM